MDPVQRRQSKLGSIAHSALTVINPFDDIRNQLTIPGIFYMSVPAMTGGAPMLYPSFFTSAFGLAGRERWLKLFGEKFGGTIWGKGLASYLGGFHLITGPQTLAKQIGLDAANSKIFVKAWKSAITRNRFRALDIGQFKNILAKTLIGSRSGYNWEYAMNKLFIGQAASATERIAAANVLASGVGTVVTAVGAGIVAANLLSGITSFMYKAAVGISEAADRFAARARYVNFGGNLEPGYLTRAAATDRQRALREIQRSQLNGRRFIGNEASQYSALM